MPVTDQGLSSDRYMLIPRTLIFLTRDEHVLLLKGAPHKRLWANKYNGLGGHIERNEDVLSAARRELAEETGLDAIHLWLCGTVIIDTGQSIGVGIFVLRGECSVDGTLTSPDGYLEWVPFSQVYESPLVEDLYTLLPRVLSTCIDDPPFSACYTCLEGDRLDIRFGDSQ